MLNKVLIKQKNKHEKLQRPDLEPCIQIWFILAQIRAIQSETNAEQSYESDQKLLRRYWMIFFTAFIWEIETEMQMLWRLWKANTRSQEILYKLKAGLAQKKKYMN